jgi:cytosine/adenosine deaminase-related metal-dependent hydrolase
MNPLASPRYALRGTIVTMDSANTVLPGGTVYIDGATIAAVQPKGAPAPAAFSDLAPVDTRGTIYPGLIELHNHLSYNALPLWNVPKLFSNRDQWTAIPEYHQLVTGPMEVLGQTPGCLEAIVRYVECRCLLGGVTTSQGIALTSNAGIMKHYRGLVRNVEAPANSLLPAAATHILDVEAKDAAQFMARLEASSCLLLHLSEGTNAAAHHHFDALHLADGSWALARSLAGIHCVALTATDFQAMQAHGASMVWSPLSNLLLYGQTADIRAAKASGILMALGSDWAPSGSKNLLGELKVARLVSRQPANADPVFTDLELVAMATRNPAQILSWDKALGSLEPGKLADLLVVKGTGADPYAHLLTDSESAVALVVIDGVPRYGVKSLMQDIAPTAEPWTVGSTRQSLNLAQADADPDVAAVTLQQACDTLKQALHELPSLPKLSVAPAGLSGSKAPGPRSPRWSLVLDHDPASSVAHRPHLPYKGVFTAMPRPEALPAASPPLPLIPEVLEDLTVADDKAGFLAKLANEPNLPDYIKDGLPTLY